MNDQIAARNVEIKARLSFEQFERACDVAAEIARSGPEWITQIDTYFCCREGRLKLRQFADQSAELISYQRPDAHRPTMSDYIRVRCDAEEVQKLEGALANSLGIRCVVRKQRRLFKVDQTRIHLDHVERLGYFLELEVVLKPGETMEDGSRVAVELLQHLEVPEPGLVACSYVDLMEELDTAMPKK